MLLQQYVAVKYIKLSCISTCQIQRRIVRNRIYSFSDISDTGGFRGLFPQIFVKSYFLCFMSFSLTFNMTFKMSKIGELAWLIFNNIWTMKHRYSLITWIYWVKLLTLTAMNERLFGYEVVKVVIQILEMGARDGLM